MILHGSRVLETRSTRSMEDSTSEPRALDPENWPIPSIPLRPGARGSQKMVERHLFATADRCRDADP